MADGAMSGFTDSKFEAVADVFQANLDSDAEVGAAFAVSVEGETVIDLWGGWADAEMTRPWEKDTLVNVWSTTKTMMALTALLLADRGELDFDAPVARYWPEFAANGKEAIKVSHLMSHSAGLSGWDTPITMDDLYDWDKVTGLLQDQAPWWEPGSAPGYHAITQGYLVGEVVRRITGRTLGTVFREEIAEPLGADFHIGLDARHDHRIADLIPPPVGAGEAAREGLSRRTVTNPPLKIEATRTQAWRAAEIPAAGGHGNARSIIDIHGLLANDGVAKGRRLLSPSGVDKALELQIAGVDAVLGMPVRFGMGFGLAGTGGLPADRRTLFWGGYGGSLAFVDVDSRTSIAYVMNKMGAGTVGDGRSLSLMMAMWRCMAS